MRKKYTGQSMAPAAQPAVAQVEQGQSEQSSPVTPAAPQQEAEKLIGGDPFSEAANPPTEEPAAPASESAPGDAEKDPNPTTPPQAPKVDESPAPAAQAGENPPAKPRFESFGKKFETAEELLEYTRELERKQVELEARASVYERVAPATPAAPSKTAAELRAEMAEEFFIDPVGASEKLEARILRRIRTEDSIVADQKREWKQFYDANEDLSDHDDIVKLVLNQNLEKWSKLPLSKAKELLATETRAKLSKIRGASAPTETLSSKPASTLGPTRGSAPRVSAPAAPVSFVEQLLAARRGKGKTA